MSAIASCSEISRAAREPLAGTATRGAEWLLVEVRGAWGRDPIHDSNLPSALRAELAAYPGKVVLIRRPDRRVGATVIRANVREGGGAATRLELGSLDEVVLAGLRGGEAVTEPLVLICTHGRRDACCARLGAPLYEAVAPHLDRERLWQASHLGGHRFAPNVVVLPHGIQLGRVPLARASGVIDEVACGRIPLDLYRGRTIYSPSVQAAEVAARRATGCDMVDALTLVTDEGERVTFATPSGAVSVRVEEQEGATIPVSCGAEPEPTVAWAASLESTS